jgi:hypothetical protein
MLTHVPDLRQFRLKLFELSIRVYSFGLYLRQQC